LKTPQPTRLDPSAFFLEGGETGVLLVHGFGGSPAEMRLVGDYLHSRGLTVSAPLLPGHGTTLEDLNRRSWREWVDHVEAELACLQGRCVPVFVAGLSMGTLLSVCLAAHHPEIPGVVLYAPAAKVDHPLIYLTPVLKYLWPVWRKSGDGRPRDPNAKALTWTYEAYAVRAAHQVLKLTFRARRLLPQVVCPALLFHAARDKHIDEKGARYAYEQIGSTDKELIVLRGSGHALTVDVEWEAVAQKTYAFFERLS
jgi:carboxylesterase